MILFLLGLITGIVGGMGIGGGTILIPGLALFSNLNQQTIQSINLLSFIPIALIALIVHYRKGNIHIKLSYPLILFGLLGTWIGSRIALRVASITLRKLFGLFLLVMGTYEFFWKSKKK